MQADGVGLVGIDRFHDQGAPRDIAFGIACTQRTPCAMRSDQWVGGFGAVAAMAGPAVVKRVRDHAGAQRVEFNGALAAKHVVVMHDCGGLVPSFPQGATAVVARIDVANVTAPERLHQARHLARCSRRDQQMDVVGHQHIGMDGAVFGEGNLTQVLQVADAVDVLEEAGL